MPLYSMNLQLPNEVEYGGRNFVAATKPGFQYSFKNAFYGSASVAFEQLQIHVNTR